MVLYMLTSQLILKVNLYFPLPSRAREYPSSFSFALRPRVSALSGKAPALLGKATESAAIFII